MRDLPKPRIGLLFGEPAAEQAAGASRFLLEHEYGYPVTAISADVLSRGDLKRYNVIILPEGNGYSTLGQAAEPLSAWIRKGGTLITLGWASRWLLEESVALLPSALESRQGEKPARGEESDEDSDFWAGLRPESEEPAWIPGAILRVRLDPEHWLAFGYSDVANVLVYSNTILKPIRLDQGRNVGLYESEDRLWLSGFAFEESLAQIANKAYLIHTPLGEGHIVSFAEDPTFRAMSPGLNRLFLNAVLLGPAH